MTDRRLDRRVHGDLCGQIGWSWKTSRRCWPYSTVSQLGLYDGGAWVWAAYTAGVFHLVTHAIFKALLFFASGSVIHGVDTQNMHEMGGLRKKMPVTFWTWIIGSAALAGIYPLAGFWSKDEILFAAYEGAYTRPLLDPGSRRDADGLLHHPGDDPHLLRQAPGSGDATTTPTSLRRR